MNKKTLAIVFGSLAALMILGAGGHFYYNWRLADVPPLPKVKPMAIHAEAGITLAPPSAANSHAALDTQQATRSAETGEATGQGGERSAFLAPENPMDDFHRQWNNEILRDLEPSFPGLHNLLGVARNGSNDLEYRHAVYRLLDAAETAPPGQRPELMFAAEDLAKQIVCEMEDQAACEQLRKEFARYQLTLRGAELCVVFVYSHDLLWRLWRTYPQSEWGERAFVLLQEYGWDTSPACEQGTDQFREVIRRGEEFLAQRPNSAQREAVRLLVAEAYATWWSLSRETRPGMADYVDAKRYQADADEARIKAIDILEELAQHAPGTNTKEYAQQVAAALRKKAALDYYRFFCIYD